MSDINQHGLTRHIPEEVKRTVRQECGFGCVICGAGIYHYEHVLPEFKDAHSHEPANIALLCASHHDLVTRGQISKDSVAKARLAPKAKELGFAAGPVEIGASKFRVIMGGATFIGGICIGALGELPILLMLPPEDPGEPARMTAFFPASDGGWSLAIFRNEWRVLSHTVWDIVVEGNTITLRRKAGDVALTFCLRPPDKVEVTALNVVTPSCSIRVGAEGLRITSSTSKKHLQFGETSQSSGIMAFVANNLVSLWAPFPTPRHDQYASWHDFLLNIHWNEGRRSHGSLSIQPDSGPSKIIKNDDGTISELLSLRIFDRSTGKAVDIAGEAEVLTLFSFGSTHLAYGLFE